MQKGLAGKDAKCLLCKVKIPEGQEAYFKTLVIACGNYNTPEEIMKYGTAMTHYICCPCVAEQG